AAEGAGTEVSKQMLAQAVLGGDRRGGFPLAAVEGEKHPFDEISELVRSGRAADALVDGGQDLLQRLLSFGLGHAGDDAERALTPSTVLPPLRDPTSVHFRQTASLMS